MYPAYHDSVKSTENHMHIKSLNSEVLYKVHMTKLPAIKHTLRNFYVLQTKREAEKLFMEE